MKLRTALMAFGAGVVLMGSAANAANLSIVSGDTGNGLAVLREQLDIFEKNTGNKVTIVPMPSSTSDQFGQYKLWLGHGAGEADAVARIQHMGLVIEPDPDTA